MHEGASSKIEFMRKGRIVVKQFKSISLGNNPIEDYENEVVVLQALDGHRDKLSYQTPRLTEHGLYQNSFRDADPVAFIKMNKLDNAYDQNTRRRLVSQEVKRIQVMQYAKALAELHSIQFSCEVERDAFRDPLAVLSRQLKAKLVPGQSVVEVDNVLSDMASMAGTSVFVHNDFGVQNVCMCGLDNKVTGLYDFCFSGMGVRELDFRYFLGGGLEGAFIDEYESVSGVALKERNLDIMRSYNALNQKLFMAAMFDNTRSKLSDLALR